MSASAAPAVGVVVAAPSASVETVPGATATSRRFGTDVEIVPSVIVTCAVSVL